MEERSLEPVSLERVRKDATCIITRAGLGNFELHGPQENILVPESRVAYATVINDLTAEGYHLVSLGDYAGATGMDSSRVDASIARGELFALHYGDETVVPLPLKEAVFADIES